MAAVPVSDIGPIVSLVSYAIGCGTVLMALGMLRGFIVRGISIAIAEFFIKTKDADMLQKMCRWFSNGDEIAEYLEEIKEKMIGEKKK